MCAGCAIAAAAGASGVRSWLQLHHARWLTPRRMRAVTLAVCAVALCIASVELGGSSAPAQPTVRSSIR